MVEPLADPASGGAVNGFHHRLWEDVRGFDLEGELIDVASELSATLRGAISLLNARLAQAPAIEEATSDVGLNRECTAFEHAGRSGSGLAASSAYAL